jgi:ribose/xylose/arabinose/galactoside ABC-type transport system permease subunit
MRNDLLQGKNRRDTQEWFRKYLCVFILLGMFLLFSILARRFFTWFNISTILEQGAVLTIAAMGETLIILAGSIDLSVGSLIGLGAVLSAGFSGNLGILSFGVAALAGIGCGAFTGLIYAKGKIPSFMATLGMLTVARGLVYVYTKGQPIPANSHAMMVVGIGRTVGIPNIVLFALAVFLLVSYLTDYTAFGRWVRGIGGAERVVGLSAVPIGWVKFFLFVLSGFLAATAGAVQASRVGSGVPTTGYGQELDVIAAVVLGGTALTGGIGHPAGTVVGAYIMTTLANGLNMLGIGAYAQMVIKGIVLAVAVLLSVDRKRIGTMK